MRTQSIVTIAAVVALIGCSNSATSYGGGVPCTPTATQVCMSGLQFSPLNLTITHGTSITWMNGDGVTHTVTSATGSPDTYNSGNITAGGTFSHTFATAGTYNYYCMIHGVNGTPPTGMHGTITVT